MKRESGSILLHLSSRPCTTDDVGRHMLQLIPPGLKTGPLQAQHRLSLVQKGGSCS